MEIFLAFIIGSVVLGVGHFIYKHSVGTAQKGLGLKPKICKGCGRENYRSDFVGGWQNWKQCPDCGTPLDDYPWSKKDREKWMKERGITPTKDKNVAK